MEVKQYFSELTGSTDLPSPRTIPGKGDIYENDQFFLNASNRTDIDPDSFFDVIAHGTPNSIQVQTDSGAVLVDQRVAARLIENSLGYVGQNIRLLSCSTEACETGFAQNLANKLGV